MYNRRFAEASYRKLYAAIFSSDSTKFFKALEVKTADDEEYREQAKKPLSTPLTTRCKTCHHLPQPNGKEKLPAKSSACEIEEWKPAGGLTRQRYSACSSLIPKGSGGSRIAPPIGKPRSSYRNDGENLNSEVMKSYESENMLISTKSENTKSSSRPRLILTSRKLKSTGVMTTEQNAKPKKPRWYDMRPRLIINRYYRKNFILNYIYKKNNALTIAQVLKRPLRAKNSQGGMSEEFEKAVFTTEPLASCNKSEQAFRVKKVKK